MSRTHSCLRRSYRGGRWQVVCLCLALLLLYNCSSMHVGSFGILHVDGFAWTPLNPESLVAAPCLIEQTLCQPSSNRSNSGGGTQPHLAKNVDYARAILEAWRQDDPNATWDTEWKSIVYNHHHETDKTPLYGHLIRNRRGTTTTTATTNDNNRNTVGILFCHTGAGPHDLFLLWKAAALVHALSAPSVQSSSGSSSSDAKTNVVILIADLLSDESGWAWTNVDEDRTRYEAAREELLRRQQDDAPQSSRRPVLERRLQAAEACLRRQVQQLQSNQQQNDHDVRIAALGWCLGGQAVVELARLKLPTVRAMVTFHGVFDNLPDSDDDATRDSSMGSEILICHGLQDPFVPSHDLEKAL